MINPFALVGEATWEVRLEAIRAPGVFFVAFNLTGPAFIACRLICRLLQGGGIPSIPTWPRRLWIAHDRLQKQKEGKEKAHG